MSKFESDFGTEETITKLLKKIIKSSPGEPFLTYKVNPDGDQEGKYELEFFELDIQGLDLCLSEVYGRQDEIHEDDLEKYKEDIIKASN